MKPSHARMLKDADLVLWVGPLIEEFLAAYLDSHISGQRQLTLADIHGIRRYEIRELDSLSGDDGHEDHHHDAHEHEDGHDDHHDAHEHEDGHDDHHDAHKHEDEHDHHADHHDGHGHTHRPGDFDAHIWLSPANARVMLAAIAARLGEIDPAHATRYQANADDFSKELDKLEDTINARLAPLQRAPFIVFHDAYQYFERAFGLHASGTITLNPESPTGARRVLQIRNAMQENRIRCVFSEPQFNQRLLRSLVDGTQTRIGQLDPIGAKLNPGSQLYTRLLTNMAESFATCLGT